MSGLEIVPSAIRIKWNSKKRPRPEDNPWATSGPVLKTWKGKK